MLRYLLAILVLIHFALYPSAQVPQVPQIRAGISITNADIQGLKRNTSKLRFYAGGAVHVRLADKFSFNPGLLYSGKGYTSPPMGVIDERDVTLEYITLPLTVSYMPFENISFYAGPETGFLIKGNARYQGKDQDLKDIFKKTDFSINIGLAVFLGNRLAMEAQYSHGLVDLGTITYIDGLGNTIGQDRVGPNRVFHAGLSYFFLRPVHKNNRSF
jgi:hypothetical protein